MDKYEKRRENRLRKIQEHLTDVVKEVVPEEAEQYTVVYKPITKYHGTTFGNRDSDVLPSQSPAYGFFLVSESGKQYALMHLFKQDVDARVKNEDINSYYQIPAFKDNIQKGIAQLKTKRKTRKNEEGGLEKTLGIISLGLILAAISFLSFNFTGNVIEGLNHDVSNILGAILFLFGIIGAFFYFRRK